MEHLLKNLKTAIFSIMEQMYFLLPDGESETPSKIDNSIAIYIGITGNPRYLITLEYDRELAGKMTTDLLGIDESELNDELIRKNLRETANIVAGNFLLSFDGEENRNITLPCDTEEEVFNGGEITDKGSIELSFNGYGVSVELEEVN